MDAAAAVLAGRHVNQSAAADAHGVSRQAVSAALARIAKRRASTEGKPAARRRRRPAAG